MRTIDQTTQEVLNLASKHFEVPAESLAPDDDFFRKLGINSLQALELLSRLENHFGIELPDYEVQGVSDFRTLASRIQSPPVMLDLSKYQSIGAALKDALEEFSSEVCLIESDREREKERLTYQEFKQRAHPLAKAMQDAAFKPADRAAIIMTNQSKWLISAYAIFHGGGVLVPLDYKLTAEEQWQLLQHSGASVLVTEYPIWRQLAASPLRNSATILKTVLVTEAPPNADLFGAVRWEEFRGTGKPAFIPRQRSDVATIVYSSGTGGRPKGCMMTHENYLEQCIALTSIYPFAPGFRYLSILPTNHAIDFMVGFLRALHLRGRGCASPHASPGICPRSFP